MTPLAKAARELRVARARLDAAMEAARAVAIAEHASGTAETDIAKALGVNRMTVRRWLGKLT
jgi:transposase